MSICPICHNQCKIPIISPCGHTFCTVCIMRYLTLEDNCFVCHQKLAKKDLKMANVTISNESEDDEKWKCPICCERLKKPTLTYCGHIFCRDCIKTWLERKSKCPMCNRVLRQSELIRVYGNDGDFDDDVDDDDDDNRWFYVTRNELGLSPPSGKQKTITVAILVFAILFYLFTMLVI